MWYRGAPGDQPEILVRNETWGWIDDSRYEPRTVMEGDLRPSTKGMKTQDVSDLFGGFGRKRFNQGSLRPRYLSQLFV